MTVLVNGKTVEVRDGSTAAAAVFQAGFLAFRHSAKGEPRAPLCGMGICFECRVTIDGEPHRLSCQMTVAQGMEIKTT